MPNSTVCRLVAEVGFAFCCFEGFMDSCTGVLSSWILKFDIICDLDAGNYPNTNDQNIEMQVTLWRATTGQSLELALA